MGVRASYEEAYTNEHRATLINGIFNAEFGEKTEVVVLPDVTNCELEICGEKFTMLSGKVEEFKASLDMKTGEFKRSLKWTSPMGKCIRLDFSRIVSDVRRHIMAQKVSVTPLNGDMEIKVLTGVNGKVTNMGVQHFTNPQKRAYSDGIKGLCVKTVQSNIDIAVHYNIKSNKACENKTVIDKRSVYTSSVYNLHNGETAVVEKISSYASSRDFEYTNKTVDADVVRQDGIKYLTDAMKLGYAELYEESSASWKEFWNNNAIEIKCKNDFLGKAIKFAQYHLYIMVSRNDNRMGIGAKALSGERYKGHSFWDTEIFLLPYYIFNAPEIARRLLEYRYKLLDVSKEKAKKYGYLGAMYPWESAWIEEGETAAEYGDLDLVTGKARRYLMGETEIHVTADIACGVWQYYCATADEEFMEKYGDEIVILTALFWTSRVEKRNERYEILGVIGPDEYKENVDNNAYTNYMAYRNLKYAQSILKVCPDSVYKKLSMDYDVEDIKSRINEVADKLCLPKSEDDGIILQFDGYKDLKEIDITPYRNPEKVATIFESFGLSEILKMQVHKQADLLMLFYLMKDMFTDDEIRRNFEYYEKKTLHDSSLSMCIHALIAARLGMDEMADDMFYKACCVDLGDNTDNSDDGIHSASIGGIWLMLALGYAGLEISEEGLSISPVLPQGWSEYSFYLAYRGSKIKVKVDANGCILERISGNEVCVNVNGKEMIV